MAVCEGPSVTELINHWIRNGVDGLLTETSPPPVPRTGFVPLDRLEGVPNIKVTVIRPTVVYDDFLVPI